MSRDITEIVAILDQVRGKPLPEMLLELAMLGNPPQVAKLRLGEDLVFDLRGLLVERFGANLRNDLAHGLTSHDAFRSIAASYLWWLALRFYLLPTIAGLRADEEANDDETNKC